MSADLVPVHFEHIYLLPEAAPTRHVVALREIAGDRRVHIWMAPDVAEAVVRGARGAQAPRPLTHDLLATAVNAIGALHELRIQLQPPNDRSYGTFIAEMAIRTPDGAEKLLDARPSDALAVALRCVRPPALLASPESFQGPELPDGAVALDDGESPDAE